jgi:hypothetical protein
MKKPFEHKADSNAKGQDGEDLLQPGPAYLLSKGSANQ